MNVSTDCNTTVNKASIYTSIYCKISQFDSVFHGIKSKSVQEQECIKCTPAVIFYIVVFMIKNPGVL